ncbi:MAG: AsmA-like C-terminal region-containing protein [Verrucomicrobiales bacterium]|jgi:hypothetical protein|nr:AsmA-like C-terminal region-containing protein [Verrucomicrobiales bacterium]
MKRPTRTRKKTRGVNWRKVLARSALGLLLAFLALIGLVRCFGLPDAITQRLSRELAARGLSVHADRWYLDVLGRVKARNIYISKTQAGVASLNQAGGTLEGTVMVQKAQVRFNWLSWWRGEPFLRGASIAQASLVFQLDAGTAARVEDVSAEVTLRAKAVEIKYLRGRWHNLRVELAGVLDSTGLAPSAARPAPDFASWAARYRRLEKLATQWTARTPLVLSGQFRVPLAKPLDGEAHLQLLGDNQWWRGVRFTRVETGLDYAAARCQLRGAVALTRGKITFDGGWTAPKRAAELSFYSDVDWSWLAAAMPERQRAILAALHFAQLPVNQGTVRMTWEQEFRFALQAQSVWRDFYLGEQQFDSFDAMWSCDGQRLMVTDLSLRGPAGALTGEFFRDEDARVRGRLDSAIDPRAFRALFGADAQPFFNSLDFKTPPELSATVSGSGWSAGQFIVSGKVAAADFAYKGVPMISAASDFDFQNHELHLAKLRVKRAEGEGGGEIWDNFKTGQVRVKGVKGTLNAQDVALVLGSKMAEYMQPYQFVGTPTFYLDGLFDLNDDDEVFDTDMKARLVAKQGAHYMFMQRRLLLTDVDLNIAVKGRKLTLTANKPLAVFDGRLDGVLHVWLVKRTGYETQLHFTNNDFAAVMKTFFNNEKVTGRIGGELNLRGEFDDLKTMRGDVALTVRDGELYSIPFLGGLSELLNAIIPDMGYAKASDAELKFTVNGGVISIRQLDIKSLFFALIGEGSYDFISDQMDLNMRSNVKGLPGILLFPVSKIFEYHGTGPIAKTRWETRNF